MKKREMKVQKQSVLVNINIKKCINKGINYVFLKKVHR